MKSFTAISIVCFLVFAGSARCKPVPTAAVVPDDGTFKHSSKTHGRETSANNLDKYDYKEYLIVEPNYFNTSEKQIAELVDTTEDYTETYTL